MQDKKRPVLGIMTGQFSEDSSIRFMHLMTEALKDVEIDIRYYFGAVSTIYLEKFAMDDIGFGCHHFSLYSYSNYEAPDILMMVFGSINVGQKQPMEIHRFLTHLPKVPVILLKENAHLPENPGSISINMDNYGGMREVVQHLIDTHHLKKIGYLSGPLDHSDSRLRLDAYRDVLEESGIPWDETLVAYGDYQNHVDPIVEEFFSRRPDMEAIVSANDEMATAVYRVAKKLGRKIGEDLAVTGFDNISIAAYMDPPLTTVFQDYDRIAVTAAEKIRKLLSGEEIRSIVVSAAFIPRSSCGCPACEEKQGENEGNINRQELMMKNWMDVSKNQMKSMVSTLMLRNLQLSVSSTKTFFEKLAQQLQILKTKSSFVCLLPEPLEMEDGEMLHAPEKLKLFMRQWEDGYEAYNGKEAPEVRFGGMRELARKAEGEHVHMTNFILFHGRTQYGIMSAEISLQDATFYEILSPEIGNALYSLLVALKEKEMQRTLEEKNQILDYAASHDELTGTLNRTGIMNRIVEYVHENKKGLEGIFVLVIADLDHLKQINDTFGHPEGDSAIRTVADVLRRALPKGSPYGRSGGDEFIGITIVKNEEEIGFLRTRMKQYCKEYNDSSGKNYTVEISAGFCVLEDDEELARTLQQTIKKADDDLYEAKKLRRPSVVR